MAMAAQVCFYTARKTIPTSDPAASPKPTHGAARDTDSPRSSRLNCANVMPGAAVMATTRPSFQVSQANSRAATMS